MFFESVIKFVLNIIYEIFGASEVVTALPFGIEGYLAEMLNYVYAFNMVFWPLTPLIVCLLWYIPFKGFMLFLRFVFGSRIPYGA